MTQEADSEFDSPEVFESLGQELTMLHNAVMSLTAAREKLRDYSATLAEIREMVDDNRKMLAALQQSPTLRMTPAAFVADIHAAAEAVRAEDRRMLDASGVAIARSVGAIDAIVQRGRAADRQHERLVWAA